MPLLLTLHKPLARIWETHIDCIATCASPWPWLQRQWRSRDSVPTGSIRAAIVATLTWKWRNCVHYFYISASYCQRGTFTPPSSYSTVCHILCNMLLWVKDHNESLSVWVIRAHVETEISSNFLCGWFDGFWRMCCQCAEKCFVVGVVVVVVFEVCRQTSDLHHRNDLISNNVQGHHQICTIDPHRRTWMGLWLCWCLWEVDEMQTIHRWIWWGGGRPLSCTPWLWCRGSPAPPLEIRGGSDNRLLSVRHGHKERAAVGAGVRFYTAISPPPHGSGFFFFFFFVYFLMWVLAVGKQNGASPPPAGKEVGPGHEKVIENIKNKKLNNNWEHGNLFFSSLDNKTKKIKTKII